MQIPPLIRTDPESLQQKETKGKYRKFPQKRSSHPWDAHIPQTPRIPEREIETTFIYNIQIKPVFYH